MGKHREVVTSSTGRDVEAIEFRGEPVYFRADSDRLQDRVTNQSHESHVLDALADELRPDDVFWDVGGRFGIHAFTLATHLPQGEVVTETPLSCPSVG